MKTKDLITIRHKSSSFTFGVLAIEFLSIGLLNVIPSHTKFGSAMSGLSVETSFGFPGKILLEGKMASGAPIIHINYFGVIFNCIFLLIILCVSIYVCERLVRRPPA